VLRGDPDPALVADQAVFNHGELGELAVHVHPDLPHHTALPSARAERWGTAGRNDTYGYALTAQPDQSQGRPTTNMGSQPTEQERPARTCSRRPLFRTVAP
jgi:hypothetical protein